MKTFKADKLPNLTKIMYDSQQKLNTKNWEDTLKSNPQKVETLLEMVSVFDTWRTSLSAYGDVTRDLIKEAFMDAYMSIHFACMALYKQAHVSLRTELETALRLVYFSSHPIEFKWWKDDKDYFKGKHAWGENYTYFMHLEEIHSFNAKLKIQLFNDVETTYRKLSKYVHGSFPAFQTNIGGVAPTYKVGEFGKWADTFKDVQKYVNTVLALGFVNEFKSMGAINQRKILRVIANTSYKKGLKQTLGLRLRGKI